MIDHWIEHHQSPWGRTETLSPFLIRIAKGKGHWTFESQPMPHSHGPMQWSYQAHWNNTHTCHFHHQNFGHNALGDYLDLFKTEIDKGFAPDALQRSWVIQALLRKNLYKAGLEGSYFCVLQNKKIWIDPLGDLCQLIHMSHLNGDSHQGYFLRQRQNRYIAQHKSGFHLDLATSRHEKLEHLAQSQKLYLRNFPVKK